MADIIYLLRGLAVHDVQMVRLKGVSILFGAGIVALLLHLLLHPTRDDPANIGVLRIIRVDVRGVFPLATGLGTDRTLPPRVDKGSDLVDLEPPFLNEISDFLHELGFRLFPALSQCLFQVSSTLVQLL